MTTLTSLGWSEHFQSQLTDPGDPGTLGRVAAEHTADFVLLTLDGEMAIPASASGPRPTVGDWVVFDRGGDGDQPRIARTLQRRSAFVRARSGGGRAQAQVIASNVDVLFIVTSANADLSPRRVERYLTAAWDGGVTPVVVLNKVDLVDDASAMLRSLRAVSPGVEVIATSALLASADDLAGGPLRRRLGPGKTCALVGSSGVGKSTLANRLLGPSGAQQLTDAVREGDAKGRHTTTGRSLHPMPCGGGLVLDTPGIREFALWFDEATTAARGSDDVDEGLARAFPEVVSLLGGCRFRDCAHEGEPGCALTDAIAQGDLSASRFDSYRKLGSERSDVRRRKTAEDRREHRKSARALAREIRLRERLKGS